MTNIRNVSQLVDHKHDLKKGDSFKIEDIKLYVTDADGLNRWRKAFQHTNLDEAKLLKEFNKEKGKFSSDTEPKKEEHHHHHHGHHSHHGHHHHNDETQPSTPRPTTAAPTPPSPRTEGAATTSTTSHVEAHKPTITITPPAEQTPSSPRTTTAAPTPTSPRTEGAATTSTTSHLEAQKPATSINTATTTVGAKPITHAPNPPKPANKKPAYSHNFWDSFKSGGEKVKDFFFGSQNRTAITLITAASIGCMLLTRNHYFQSMLSKFMSTAKSYLGKS